MEINKKILYKFEVLTNMQLKTSEDEPVNLNAYDNKEDIQLFLKQKKYLTILLIKDI